MLRLPRGRAKRVILALIVAAGGAFVVYYGPDAWIGAADTVKAAIIAALISVFTFAAAKYYEQREIYRQRIVKEKTDCYLKVINLLFDVLKPQQIRKQQRKIDDRQLADSFFDIQKDMMVWGSDAVIESWISFRRKTEAFAIKDEKDIASIAPIMHSTGNLILTIRMDIGYSGTNLTENDIAGLILKIDDPDNQKLLDELKKQ